MINYSVRCQLLCSLLLSGLLSLSACQQSGSTPNAPVDETIANTTPPVSIVPSEPVTESNTSSDSSSQTDTYEQSESEKETVNSTSDGGTSASTVSDSSVTNTEASDSSSSDSDTSSSNTGTVDTDNSSSNTDTSSSDTNTNIADTDTSSSDTDTSSSDTNTNIADTDTSSSDTNTNIADTDSSTNNNSDQRGREFYVQQCLSCHGDEQGEDVNVGGALIASQCNSCADEQQLIHEISTTMPKGEAELCDTDCATAISGYILANFDGYNEQLSGEEQYNQLCKNCHGNGINDDGTNNKLLVPATCTSCNDRDTLISSITNTMPFNNPQVCNQQCATLISDYMIATFPGYQQSVERNLMHLSAPTNLQFSQQDNGLMLTWDNYSQAPANWILERFDEDKQRWQLISSIGGSITEYLDSQHSGGHYRLYALNAGVASVPLHATPASTTISAATGAVGKSNDNFYFIYQAIKGDFVMEFSLDEMLNSPRWGKAGIMIRDDLDPSAHMLYLNFMQSEEKVDLTKRIEYAGDVGWFDGKALALPVKLKLQRDGDYIRTYLQQPGNNWVSLKRQTVEFTEQVYVGIGISSNDARQTMQVHTSGLLLDEQVSNQWLTQNIGQSEGDYQAGGAIKSDQSRLQIDPVVEVANLAHINRFEFTQQLKDIAQLEELTLALAADDSTSGYEVGKNSSNLSIQKYLDAAETYAQQIAADLLSKMDCADPQCEQSYVESVIETYLRLPATQQQKLRFAGVYWNIADKIDQQAAMQGLIEALVQSTGFLYKLDNAGANMPADTIVPVTGMAMAYRLSEALWASVPDSELEQAALNGELVTPAQIKDQAQRMLDDDKAKQGFRNFYMQWLQLEPLLKADREVEDINFDTLAQPMLDGLQAYMEEIVFAQHSGGDLSALFSSNLVGQNAALNIITGLNASGEQTQLLTSEQHMGLLGQPAILANLAHADKSSIVDRGVFINKQFLCSGFPPPPDDIPLLDSIDAVDKSAFERLNELTSTSGCVTCHQYINPVGGTLEHFDAIGRYRTIDDLGQPVMAKHELFQRQTGESIGEIDGLDGMNSYLAQSQQAANCFIKQYLTYAIGRVPSSNEQASIAWLEQKLLDDSLSIKQLLLETTQTPVFLYKKTATVEN